MSYETIAVSVADGVAEVTVDRPEKGNALSPTALAELGDAFADLRDEVQVLVLTGAGDYFCTGLDLELFFEEARKAGPDAVRANTKEHGRAFNGLKDFPGITIAKVNGYTVGGGFMLMALCDLAVAAEGATFSLSEINFGHPPGGGVMWCLVNLMDRRDAMYYSVTGEPFDAPAAEEMGVINEVVPESDLDDRTADLATDIADKNALALEYTKTFHDRVQRMDYEEAREYELAKGEEMKYYQGYEFLDEGIGGFNREEYRPAAGENYRTREEE
jgi:trans-feruloyl-CoA hydratase/vanillin synthase